MRKRQININDKFGDYTIISKPYKINNVLFVDIQRMKSDFPLIYFIDICNKISKNNTHLNK